MKKKILLGLSAAGTAIALLPLLAAFEAHVINVTAHIENALNVQRDEIPFGTVFPEEHLFSEPFDISLSHSFLEQKRLDDVTYVIKQKPKCEKDANNATSTDPLHKPVDLVTHECPGFYHEMPLLCPYLSKEKDKNDESLPTDLPPYDTEIAALHGDPNNWDIHDATLWAKGKLTQAGNDIVDNWVIDLLVPCFEGQCAQLDPRNPDIFIPPAYQLPCDDVNNDGQCDLNGQTFGCDLWVEVNGYSLPPATETGTLTIIKHVQGDGADEATDKDAPDFTIDVTGTTPSTDLFLGAEIPGTVVTFGLGPYSVDEVSSFNYSKVLGAGCSGVIVAGDNGTCTITNTELPQCSDGIDNEDPDSLVDIGDPGCHTDDIDPANPSATYDPSDDSELDALED